MEGVGQPVLSFEQCFILFCNFPLVFAFVVGGLGFEFCVFVAGWRHALRSEWPFIIIIIISINYKAIQLDTRARASIKLLSIKIKTIKGESSRDAPTSIYTVQSVIH